MSAGRGTHRVRLFLRERASHLARNMRRDVLESAMESNGFQWLRAMGAASVASAASWSRRVSGAMVAAIGSRAAH